MNAVERIIHRWTIDERLKLRAVAKLSHLRVELLDGELLEKSDDGGALHGGPHRWTFDEFIALREDPAFAALDSEVFDGEVTDRRGRATNGGGGSRRLAEQLRPNFAAADGFIVHERMPLRFDQHTVLVPDVALTCGTGPNGGSGEDWLLLVDVAHHWHREVVEARARCMARHRVAEYWHVDPVRRAPSSSRWRITGSRSGSMICSSEAPVGPLQPSNDPIHALERQQLRHAEHRARR
jgi:hypothetical protein